MKKEWLFFCILFFIVSLCPAVSYSTSISGFSSHVANYNVVTMASVYSKQVIVADNKELSILQVIAEQNAETLSGMVQRCANNENIHSISREKMPLESTKADCNLKKI